MQQTYNRALYSLGPDVGCYAPPMLMENELKESLQVIQIEIKKAFKCSISCRLLDLRIGITLWKMLTELFM